MIQSTKAGVRLRMQAHYRTNGVKRKTIINMREEDTALAGCSLLSKSRARPVSKYEESYATYQECVDSLGRHVRVLGTLPYARTTT